MITRELDPDAGQALVTFALPTETAPDGPISVVGDFNDWDPHAHPLQGEDGWRRASLRIPTGRRYRFRYLNEPDHWLNDADADDYEPNDHGGHDAVLDLTGTSANGNGQAIPAEQDGAAEHGVDTTGIATDLTTIAATNGVATSGARSRAGQRTP